MQACLAQPFEFRCTPLLSSISKTPPYARVPDDESCEGCFEQIVSQPFIELLSLTRHLPDALQCASARLLQIRADASTQSQLLIQPTLTPY